tara:strand:- start:122 stop:346 length:225 start_codon:yes stop_codon:yes gene_type:complete
MKPIHNSTEKDKKDKKAKSKTGIKTATIRHAITTSARGRKNSAGYSHSGIRVTLVPKQGLLIMRHSPSLMIFFD